NTRRPGPLPTFFFSCLRVFRALHSFPTRRSSDLRRPLRRRPGRPHARRVGGPVLRRDLGGARRARGHREVTAQPRTLAPGSPAGRGARSRMSPSAHASGDVTEVLASFRAELGELDAERARRVRAQFDAAKGEPPPLGARSFPAHDVVLVSAPARHGARTAAVAALAFAVVVGALAAVTLIGRGTGDREVAASVPARSLAELAGLARRRSDE